MPDIHISDDVAAVLGPEGIARAAEISLSSTQCTHCGQPLGGAVNLLVRTNGQLIRTAHAHAACGPSTVLPLDTEHHEVAEDQTVHLVLDVLDHEGTELPVLLAEFDSKIYALDGAESVDLIASHLLGRGFSLISRLRQAPAQAPGWIAALLVGRGPGGEDGLLVLEPDATQLYAGTIEPPGNWLPLAARYGWAVLYTGPLGLADVPRGDRKARLRALSSAARTGRLVGARINVMVPA